MTNNDLLILVSSVNQHLSRAIAVEKVSLETGLSVKGVSGRVTKAAQSIEGRTALMIWQQKNVTRLDKAQMEIENIVRNHTHQFEALRELWNLTYAINFDRVGEELTSFNPFTGKEYRV